MKKIIAFAASCIFATSVFSQTVQLNRDELLLKAKKQKSGAWVCLVGGTALTVLAGFAYKPDKYVVTGYWTDPLFGIDWPEGHSEKQDNTGATILGITGFGLQMVSIPLFIAARDNKKKAASLSFKSQSLNIPERTGWSNRLVPSVRLTFQL